MLFDNGIYTVIPTPFHIDDQNQLGVDIDALFNLIERQLIASHKKSIKGILFGSTSEVNTLSFDEKESILQNVFSKFYDKIFIIASIEHNDTFEATRQAFKLKDYCHGFMITVPYYNNPSQEDIYNHILFILKSLLDREFLINNIPKTTNVGIKLETIINYQKENINLSGLTDNSNNFDLVYEIKKY